MNVLCIICGSNDLSLHEVELSCNNRCQQIEINTYPDSPLFISNAFSASGQFEAAELIRYSITKPQRRQPDQIIEKLLQMAGDVHPNPGPATKYPCPVCTRNVTSRGVSYKCTSMLWMGAREMFWNLKCSPVSEEK